VTSIVDISVTIWVTGLPVALLALSFFDWRKGAIAAIASIGCGASVVEKLITLDKTMAGPDHATSLEPNEFAAMVVSIREVEIAKGDGVKLPKETELKNINPARKSLVAARDIVAGEPFSEDNLTQVRPGGGVSPPPFLGYTWSSRIPVVQTT